MIATITTIKPCSTVTPATRREHCGHRRFQALVADNVNKFYILRDINTRYWILNLSPATSPFGQWTHPKKISMLFSGLCYAQGKIPIVEISPSCISTLPAKEGEAITKYAKLLNKVIGHECNVLVADRYWQRKYHIALRSLEHKIDSLVGEGNMRKIYYAM